MIIDSQSVKNTDTAKEKTMMPEKNSRIKLHAAVDSQACRHTISVTIFGYLGKNFANEVHKIISSKVEI